MAKQVPAALRKYLAELGRKGGKKAGKTMTPEQRSERARKAAAGRWKKKEK
jgi:hypothetical protein